MRSGPGTFIAAIGSSLPTSRELDDRALERAAVIAVEWRTQSLREAGELVQAAPGVVSRRRRSSNSANSSPAPHPAARSDEITLYKSVGVGLEDIAVAGLAWRRIAGG